MATDVTMPRLSDSMEEGTVLKWLVEEGGEVKRGEPLVEIETDKANMTYEADTDGTLIEIVAAGGRHARDRRGDRADRRGAARATPAAERARPTAADRRSRGGRGAGADESEPAKPRPRRQAEREPAGDQAKAAQAAAAATRTRRRTATAGA